MSSFITNEGDKKLKDRIIELIANSKELKFLVGFFYFSGIRELYDSLKDRTDIEIKVLTGLSVDKGIHGLTEYAENEENLNNHERAERFFKSIANSINSDDFDTEDFYEQVKFFIRLIKENRLIIKKTSNPNHAKLYIFKLKDEFATVKKSIFITGSSNLTKSGLITQEEFNVEISDYGTKEAEDFFDALWKDALPITESEAFKTRLIDLIENKTLIAEVTPFEAFALILKTYLETYKPKTIKQHVLELLEKSGYKPYSYQKDAASQALSIIENYHGVIIADVVGLGKSVIASMVAKHLGKRGVIICRPGLIGDPDTKNSGWHKYKEDFKLYDWEIRSSGKLNDVLMLVRENTDFEVIILDEAHNFRNQDTQDYELLTEICRNKIVILLTATPFNNTPGDIFSLLKLFIIPAKSKITLDDNLDAQFRHHKSVFDKLSFIKKNHNSTDAHKREKVLKYFRDLFDEETIDLQKVDNRARQLAGTIKAVLEPVLIRRNRLDLKKDPVYSKQIYALPDVNDPKELFFELTKEQSEFYDRVINEYFGEDGDFKGAIYQPFLYESGLNDSEDTNDSKEEANRERLMQKNLYDFMRRLLVKRFESSFAAFQQSLKNFWNITDIVQKFIKKSGKYILERKLLEQIYESDLEIIENELAAFAEKLEQGTYPKTHKVYKINAFKDAKAFLNDIEADKKLFEHIQAELESLKLVQNDPKSKSLVNEIHKVFKEKPKQKEPQRKLVIFTEYVDTAEDIERKLGKDFADEIITVKGDLTKQKVNDILENFDAGYNKQKDKFRILIATDKISEGFNLNRAGAIINYDIPWNPTRVIQRVGRINRISKKVFSELFLYNFFPTEQGATVVRSRQIAQEKMFLIHNALGEDVKIFDPGETPTPSGLYQKVMTNPETLDEESFQTKLRQKYFEIQEAFPDTIKRISELSSRVKTAKESNQNELLVFIKKGLGFFVRGIVDEGGNVNDLTFEDVYHRIECKKDEKALSLGGAFWGNYEKIKQYKEPLRAPTSEQSVENKARNNLQYLHQSVPELGQLNRFIRILLEDILEYKTLSLYTLRRIASLKVNVKGKENLKKIKDEIEKLQWELGAEYMQVMKEKLEGLSSEVIIAFENRKE